MFERVNLVPQPPLAAKIKNMTPLICGALLLVSCLVVFLLGKQVAGENSQLRDEIMQLESQKTSQLSQEAAIKQLSFSIAELQAKEKKIRKSVANLMLIAKSKPQYSKLFLHIGRSVPSTVRCEKISFNEERGQISGTATMYKDLPAFVEKIREMAHFHTVVLQVVNQLKEQEDDLLSFNIVFGLR